MIADMQRPKICLCLTGNTLAEDLAILNTYRKWIDMAELRVDYLEKDERLQIRHFPAMAGLPCILTIRRKIDGGQFLEGEASRTMLFARGLAFAEQDTRKNFAYIDFEEDFHVPSLQDAALAFETRIIRSAHDMENPVYNICERLAKMRTTGFEIPKLACMPHSLSDVTHMFAEAASLADSEHILCAMGPLGLPSRILAGRLHSFLTYTSPKEPTGGMQQIGHIDPVTLNEIYNFRAIDANTKLYGITGYPLAATDSPRIHNEGYRKHGMNAAYVPVRAATVSEALEFAAETGIQGLSVTIPHKEKVLEYLPQVSAEVGEIDACNTIVRTESDWFGYNTDAYGLSRAVCDFMNVKNLAHCKVAIIGSGGAAKAAAFAVKQLRGKACIFNRTVSKAKQIAENFNFKWAPLGPESADLLEKYSDLIIQTTPKGMGAAPPATEQNDPIFFYDFKGYEAVYDVVYVPEITPVMARAKAAGCKVSNGHTMLEYQAYKQFELFTGAEY
ncbi:3-dehydroquinate dehydratase [Treponema brennaborense DSM 12168]|uniref:3-dehydroquinate dehydratase n=2 Tax=Treponema TaxID=157 RepID=F4LL34_TREBD|nr:3-dehydroquinate dehydratase [Treponema brennaborense DSM 12168]